MLRRWVRPQLWTYHQYPPRPLVRQEVSPRLYEPLSLAIATPARNASLYLRPAIESVLDQSYPKLTYVVQDCASTDATSDVLTLFGDRIIAISEPDDGQADAVNRAFAKTSTEIMGWLNADDLYLPGCFQAISETFAAHPTVDLVYGNRVVINRFGLEVGRFVLPPDRPAVAGFMNFIPQETLFWRRRVWEELGGLDRHLRFAMDWDFTLRARQAGFRFLHLDRFLGCFRSHAAQKTVQLRSIGVAESDTIQRRYLGYVPGDIETVVRVSPYVAASWQARLKATARARV